MEWDFSANQEIDDETLGKAPESYRGAYVKDEATGKHKIADTFRPFVDAIVGLGGALKGERNVTKDLKGRKDASEQVKALLGFDTLEEAKARFDEMNTTITTASKVDPAKIKADIQKTYDGQIAEKDKQLDAMKGTLDKYMVQSAAVGAIAAAKGNAKLLMPLVREQVELVADGDEWVVRVKDGQGDYRGNGKGGFMTVEELVAEMRASKDLGLAFESDSLGGTQTQTGQRPGQQAQRQVHRQQAREDMSATDRIQAGLQQRRRGR